LRIAYRVHIYLDKLLCIFIDADFINQTNMKLKFKTFSIKYCFWCTGRIYSTRIVSAGFLWAYAIRPYSFYDFVGAQ